MNDCRAAVITAHNQPLEIQRVPIPDPLEPGALLVKITASTLCGTDVHRWHGPLPGGDTLPIITGHEPCGVVEAINGDRTDILGKTGETRRSDRLELCQLRFLLLLQRRAPAVHLFRARLLGAQSKRSVPLPTGKLRRVHVRSTPVSHHQSSRRSFFRFRSGIRLRLSNRHAWLRPFGRHQES